MPINLLSYNIPLSKKEINNLWKITRNKCLFSDDEINIRCINKSEMKDLNKKYCLKNTASNVLTFSYEGEHDIAICLSVIDREAQELKINYNNYMALILVHAFLHVTGIDHENSDEEAIYMRRMERVILETADFKGISLLRFSS